MYMRLGFSVAAHIQADVLLLDEVFAVGDEEFQRKCFGKIHEFKSRGGTIVFVSHDAQAVERLCDRAVLLAPGSVVFDGSTREAIAEYRRLLAGERSPDELAAGLREWGSGEARIVVGAAPRRATASERAASSPPARPCVVELVVVADAGHRAADASRSSSATTTGSSSAASPQATDELGWGAGAGRARSCASRSTGCRSPTATSTSAAR